MKLLDFLVPEAIITDLHATAKEEAIREIVRSVQDAGHLVDVDTQILTDSFMKREALASTGFKGFACPHGGHKAVDRPFGTVALSHSGVAFDAADGNPVHIIVLLFHAPDQFSGRPVKPGDIYDAFHAIAKLLKDDSRIDRLRQCGTRAEVVDVLADLDGNFLLRS
jgi:mannitol/fructose-specific phosphotransferase system IIA component (Ntr-type)